MLRSTVLGFALVLGSQAFAQCDVARVEIVRYLEGHESGLERWGYALEARDETGDSLWTVDFGLARKADAVVLPVEGSTEGAGDGRILVIGGNRTFLIYDCAGDLLETVGGPPGADGLTTGRFVEDGKRFLWFLKQGSLRDGIRAFDVPTDNYADALLDPSAYEIWERRLDGVDAPFDDGGVWFFRVEGQTLEITSVLWDRYGEVYGSVDYVFEAATGDLQNIDWVADFGVEDDHSVVARARDGSVRWTRVYDAPVFLAATRSRRGARWTGSVVLDGDDVTPPTLRILDAEGGEVESSSLGDAAPTARIVDVFDAEEISECWGHLPYGECTTYGSIFAVADSVEQVVSLHPIEASTGAVGTWAVGSMLFHDFVVMSSVPVVVGERAGIGPVLWFRSTGDDYPLPHTRVLSEESSVGAEETIVDFVQRSERRAEMILSSGRSVFFKALSGSWVKWGRNCVSYDTDGDLEFDVADRDALIDQFLLRGDIDADARCRADIDEFESADLTDLVRMHDRLTAGGLAPTGTVEFPGRVADVEAVATVVAASLHASDRRIYVDVRFSAPVRAVRFAIDPDPAMRIMGFSIEDEAAAVARQAGTYGLLVWDEAVDAFQVRIDLAVLDPRSFEDQLVLRRFAVATDDLQIAYPQPQLVDLSDVLSTIDDDTPPNVDRPVLGRPFPNPFNPGVQIDYVLERAHHVRFEILDVRGRRVRILVDEVRPAGEQFAMWFGRDQGGHRLASGVYWARFVAGGVTETRKLVLLE